LASISALHDPVRRTLYLYVLAQRRPVSRDEAGEAAGVRRGLAAFHLDRLATDGLVKVEYRRLTGRSGPGAGRPAKLYAPTTGPDISLPPAAYLLAAELLAEAVESREPGGSGDPPAAVAERFGWSLGARLREALGPQPSTAERLAAAERVLASHGYQPCREAAQIRLRNCPFHSLADRHRELVCGMNEALLRGVLASLRLRGVKARLQPTPGECCVVMDLGRTRRARQG
jgi:predicted ArsR family transcriptional regulator